MAENKSRKIIVTVNPRGEGEVRVCNEQFTDAVAFPDSMTGSEALKRAKKFQEIGTISTSYSLEINDHSRDN